MNFKGLSSVNRRRFGSRLTTTGLMVNATESDGPAAIKTKLPKRGMRTPTAGRVQFLTMMDAEVVAGIKDAAEEERAWDVMEEAAREWLKRRAKKSASKK